MQQIYKEKPAFKDWFKRRNQKHTKNLIKTIRQHDGENEKLKVK